MVKVSLVEISVWLSPDCKPSNKRARSTGSNGARSGMASSGGEGSGNALFHAKDTKIAKKPRVVDRYQALYAAFPNIQNHSADLAPAAMAEDAPTRVCHKQVVGYEILVQEYAKNVKSPRKSNSNNIQLVSSSLSAASPKRKRIRRSKRTVPIKVKLD